MAPTIPTVEPSRFAAGETVQWTKIVADYPNTDGFSLIYSFGGPTELPDITATNAADGSYAVTINAATTASLAPGAYSWRSLAVSGSGSSIIRHPVESGVIVISQNLIGGKPVLSHAVRTLEVIEAKIEGRLTADMQSYSIGGRAIAKIPIRELFSMRAMYRAEVWRERNPGRAGPSRKVAFVRP